MIYRHTQIGYVLIGCLGASLVVCLSLYLSTDYNPIVLLVSAILLITLLLMPSLSVQVDEEQLECAFGFGLIHRTIPLSQIEVAEAVTNRWYWGWGIRITPRGWLWNVSGLEAVELTYQNGKHFRIGTDDARGLSEVLQRAIAAR